MHVCVCACVRRIKDEGMHDSPRQLWHSVHAGVAVKFEIAVVLPVVACGVQG